MSKKLSGEQILKLQEPLPREAVSPHPTKTYLSSIKPIYVVERFNDVFGIGGWLIKNEFVEKDGKFIVIKATFEAQEYGVLIPDIFGGNDNSDLGDAYKGACSDALTKIGSYLGVGMDVYKGLADKGHSNGVDKTEQKIENNLPWLNEGSDEFNGAVSKMKAGKSSVPALRKYFKISKKTESALLNATK